MKWAIQYNNFEIIKTIIESGKIDIHYDNDVFIRYACDVDNPNLQIIKYLTEKGAYIHVDNDEPILIAALMRRKKIVDYLIENGSKIYTINSKELLSDNSKINKEQLKRVTTLLGLKSVTEEEE